MKEKEMTKDVFKFLNEFKSDIDIAEEIFNDENAINESIDDFLFEETIDELIEEAALTISEDIADDMIIEAVDLSQYRKGGSKEGKLPPHLAKFIDPKTGNFTKDAEARIQKGKKSKASFKDVTPKGYGPKESVELDEKAPKIDPEKYAAHMSRNKKAVRKTSASQDYIKDVQKRSNKMAREEMEESVEIDETISDQKMEMLRKAYSSMPERLSIDQINKLKSVLSKFSKSELEQVKKAKINWLSSMAITLKASTQY
jgi:ribosomal protein L9